MLSGDTSPSQSLHSTQIGLGELLATHRGYRRRSRLQCAAVVACVILPAAAGAVWIALTPPFRTFTSPELGNGTALRLEYPSDWMIEWGADSVQPNNKGVVKFRRREPDRLRAWIEAHFLPNAAFERAESSIEIYWSYPKIDNIDSFQRRFHKHPMPPPWQFTHQWPPQQLQSLRLECALGSVLRIDYETPWNGDTYSTQEDFVFPPAASGAPHVELWCNGPRSASGVPFQAGGEIVSRMRLVSVADGTPVASSR